MATSPSEAEEALREYILNSGEHLPFVCSYIVGFLIQRSPGEVLAAIRSREARYPSTDRQVTE